MGQKKTGHYIIGDNFVKCGPIFTVFALLQRKLNLQQNLCNIFHYTGPTLPWEICKINLSQKPGNANGTLNLTQSVNRPKQDSIT